MTDATAVQFPGQMAAFPMLGVVAEVVSERQAQDAYWGTQNHPDGTGPDLLLLDGVWSSRYVADEFRARCQGAAARGAVTWRHILLEEVFEAMAASPDELRGELVQVAAVACAWIESIDRRSQR